jgi:hypothetical protein
MHTDDNIPLTTKLPPMIRATIERIAVKDDRSLTGMTRRLLQEALAHRGELPSDSDAAL